MAGLKKARKAAEKKAAQAKQQYVDRSLAPQQAPQTQPTNPWLMTTADMPSEKDLL